MDRCFYLNYAAKNPAMPIATHLVLHEQADPQSVLHDGAALGRVMATTAARYGSPLAMALMDLALEQSDLVDLLGMAGEAEALHFDTAPTAEMFDAVRRQIDRPFNARIMAQHAALRYVAEHTDLLPVGMVIGPFSLMTKLVADPITPVALAGMGYSSEDDAEVRCMERVLQLAQIVVARSLWAQARAGARAVCVCEPAANRIYLSPNQIEQGADIFERYVMQPNRRLRAWLDTLDMDLIFHNCGELSDMMVEQFAHRLEPVMLSLGSSRVLWNDAARVPKSVVLYGNLPSKQFFNDGQLSVGQVSQMAQELSAKMAEANHPFVLGTECDVLHVPGFEQAITAKVNAMCQCGEQVPSLQPSAPRRAEGVC